MTAAIELARVTRSFRDPEGREVVAVRAVDLTVASGETLCLIGPSGCGKTSTLRLINRLLEPTSGEIRVGGVDVRRRDVIALRRGMGYVVQAGALFPHMTVRRNVGLLCELEGWSRADIEARVDTLLRLVNLPADAFARRYPRELSGGQRQRVGVARALALDPPVVLMDEPFGALDPITRGELQGEMAELKARLGKTMVVVTHDMAEAFRLGDRVALMDGGVVVQVGTLADFRERPATPFVERFLGEHLRGGVASA